MLVSTWRFLKAGKMFKAWKICAAAPPGLGRPLRVATKYPLPDRSFSG